MGSLLKRFLARPSAIVHSKDDENRPKRNRPGMRALVAAGAAALIMATSGTAMAFNNAANDMADPAANQIIVTPNGPGPMHQQNQAGNIPSNPIMYEFLGKKTVRINAVSDETAAVIIAQLRMLDDITPPGQDIEIRINSPGGSVTAGLAIYDAIRSMDHDVRTVCEGQAVSMGAFLLAAAGTPGKRMSFPNCRVMIHQPSGGYGGQITDLQIHAAEGQRLKELLLDILAERTGTDRAVLEEKMERDNFLTPEAAKELGLLDVITTHRDDKKPRITVPRLTTSG